MVRSHILLLRHPASNHLCVGKGAFLARFCLEIECFFFHFYLISGYQQKLNFFPLERHFPNFSTGRVKCNAFRASLVGLMVFSLQGESGGRFAVFPRFWREESQLFRSCLRCSRLIGLFFQGPDSTSQFTSMTHTGNSHRVIFSLISRTSLRNTRLFTRHTELCRNSEVI